MSVIRRRDREAVCSVELAIMNDRTFERGLIALTAFIIVWMVIGSIFIMNAACAIVIGLVVWIVGGWALLYC